jgi:hypothetical protein
MEKKSKFQSRKFLLCLADVLMGIGATIAGMCFEDERIILVGAIMTAVGTGIYTFCEAWVDRAAVGMDEQTTGLPDEYVDSMIL